MNCLEVRAGHQVNRGESEKGWCWTWSYNTLVTWCEEPIHWKRPQCWERDWRQMETQVTEDEMVGRHHQLNGHEFEQTLGDGEGQESLVCCSPWGWRNRHNWAIWTTRQSRPNPLSLWLVSCARVSWGVCNFWDCVESHERAARDLGARCVRI